jgi:hypothetical protein
MTRIVRFTLPALITPTQHDPHNRKFLGSLPCGDNSYPEDEDDDESQLFAAPPRGFERFLKAVSDLIDGRNFA